MEEQKDRSALPTVFGFDFQEVAGLILTLFYLKDVKEISIEGKKQDIELILNNGEVIYAQAKATTKFDSSTLEKFKEGMVTLIENSQLNNAKKLIYVTNSIYPLGKASRLKTFFGSGDKEKRYTFNDFKKMVLILIHIFIRHLILMCILIVKVSNYIFINYWKFLIKKQNTKLLLNIYMNF